MNPPSQSLPEPDPGLQSQIAGTTISVQVDSLQNVQTYLNERAVVITDQLTQLARFLNTLDWSGQSWGYYEGLQNEWNFAAEGLFSPTGVLGTIASAMGIVWNNYSECEWTNSQTWQTA